MKELIKQVEQWAEDRNFFGKDGATPEMQFKKLVEEVGELAKHLVRGQDVKDDIGDVAVVIIIMAKMMQKERPEFFIMDFDFNGTLDWWFQQLISFTGDIARELKYEHIPESYLFNNMINVLGGIAHLKGTTIKECLTVAYNEIKDRKGKWVNGAFIKQEDLK